jgi:MFS family permease
MWMLGFFLHEIAFGLLSIFLPLYITGAFVGGTMVDFGIMTALATLSAIPFSFFWGYLCDKIRHYKLFILVSFASISTLLYLFTLTTNIALLIFIFAIIAIVHVAHETPKNVLIAESYSRPDWEKNFASYELLTEIGWSIGLLLGFFVSNKGFSGASILLLCALLNLAAFLLSAIFIADPPFIFERGLASVERVLNFTQRGVTLALRASEGKIAGSKFKNESLSKFCLGLVLFSLATSMLFTPLPIFFLKDLAVAESFVFVIFTLNSAGGCIGYFFARKTQQGGNKGTVKITALIRCVLTILLIPAALYTSVSTMIIAVAVLVCMGLAYALFLISTLSISMELLPEGKAGLFNGLVGLGGVVGCLIGPLMATSFSFLYVFLASSIIFLMSFLTFKSFA